MISISVMCVVMWGTCVLSYFAGVLRESSFHDNSEREQLKASMERERKAYEQGKKHGAEIERQAVLIREYEKTRKST